jgi:hypothetical protein
MNPHVVIFFASLNQKDPLLGVFAQAIGQHAASATGADDDVVVGIGLVHSNDFLYFSIIHHHENMGMSWYFC